MTQLTFDLGTLLVVALLSSMQPYFTRPELFFAVTVTAEFRRSAPARSIVRLYAIVGWFGTAVSAILLLSNSVPGYVGVVFTVLAWIAAFCVARRRTQPHRSQATSIRETSLSLERERLPGGLAGALGPFVILAGKAVYANLNWSDIPDRFPVHWGLNGPDRWVDRTPLAVYGSIAGVAAMCLLMVVIAYGTIDASRKVSVVGPAADSERRFRSASALGLLALAYVFALVLPPVAGGTPEIPFAPVLILAVVAVYIGVLIRFGQGGTRQSQLHTISSAVPVGDRTLDNAWKFGMFYYNPEDPALVVEKRFGIGWTLNLGNRWCWMIVPLLFVPLAINLIGK